MNVYIILILSFCLSYQLSGQEIPPVEVYGPNDYAAENQNWGISQAANKYIYVANSKGLLEFNGENWRLYLSPNQTIMRSVNVVDDKIYTGCYMEFGFWKKNRLGELEYESLSKNLQEPLIEDEEFWNIFEVDAYIVFQSLNRIYLYDTTSNTFSVINSDTLIKKAFKVEGTIYFQKFNDGIYGIEEGKAYLLTNNDTLKNNEVVGIFEHEDGLLIQTKELGFFQLIKGNVFKWKTKSSNRIDELSVYNSLKLKNGGFVLGTISNGLFQLNADGEIEYQINSTNGLSNNTVLSVFEDLDQNTWLGLDNGINCINATAPFRIYNDEKGTIGTVYTSAIHNDYLYLGTNQGLFYKRINTIGEFTFIDGSQGQVWQLKAIANTLFCGHNEGTFIVENGVVKKISGFSGTWDIQEIEGQSNLLLQGNYNGLNVLEKINGTWQFRNKIEGFNNSSKYFAKVKDRILVSHEYKGLFNIKVDADLRQVQEIVQDSRLKKGLHSSLTKYNSKVLYSSQEGVFKYDYDSNSFKKDSLFSAMFERDNYTSGKLVSIKPKNQLWAFNRTGLSYLAPSSLSSGLKLHHIAIPNGIRDNMIGYENILHLDNQKYLFGTSSGYLIIDLDRLEDKEYVLDINSISKQIVGESSQLLDKSLIGDFKNNENNLKFSYSITEYDKYFIAEYQYKLENMYEQWSSWNTSSTASFKNLPYGDYTFKVRSRVGDNLSNEVGYTFTIAKPWYLSNFMMIFYILSIVLLSVSTHTLYRRYYRKQRERLLSKSEHELELKKLENEQQLMSFKNEQLRQDVESKNRELAISTMSLIKKNEFLNTIKEELKGTDQHTNLKNVVKIIDKNLNNTDDWKLFKEAFNNADKDFLKKIKEKHANLTPNDLKLCAYLRLNLSSKEIAPLLNISPRSVEVKRYRLRKKIDLPHESSLTNYILEI